MLDMDVTGIKFQLAEKNGLCPVCGQNMAEADRLREGNHIFVWFKCVKQECDGQWLQRRRCLAS